MEFLVHTVMIAAFLKGLFFLGADVTGNAIIKLMFRLLGLIGTFFPILFYLKYFEII